MTNKDILKIHHHTQEDLFDAYKIFFGTLVSEPRLKIVNLLRKSKKNVSQIMKELNIDQTSASHNLSRLKLCGFVESEIKGKFRYYSLNNETIKPLMNMIDEHMSRYCVHILKNMKKSEK